MVLYGRFESVWKGSTCLNTRWVNHRRSKSNRGVWESIGRRVERYFRADGTKDELTEDSLGFREARNQFSSFLGGE